MSDMTAEERANSLFGDSEELDPITEGFGNGMMVRWRDGIADQIRQAETAARKAALEEAADYVLAMKDTHYLYGDFTCFKRDACRDAAKELRALAESDKPQDKTDGDVLGGEQMW